MTSEESNPLAFRKIVDANEVPALGGDDVHLWLLQLNQPSPMMEVLAASLNIGELARASRFRTTRDQRRFVVARGLLRRLLGSYLDVESAQVRFEYGAFGKPFIQNEDGQPRLQFNLSHSGNRALVGITPKRAIGVDIEAVRDLPDAMNVALQNFAPGELAALEKVKGQRRIEAFYACWTRKEAYVKALGGGLALALNRFQMSVAADEDTTIISGDGESFPTDTYAIFGLAPLLDFRGAIAVRGRESQVQRFRLA